MAAHSGGYLTMNALCVFQYQVQRGSSGADVQVSGCTCDLLQYLVFTCDSNKGNEYNVFHKIKNKSNDV